MAAVSARGTLAATVSDGPAKRVSGSSSARENEGLLLGRFTDQL
jgi:hypothetical protein